MQQRRKSLFFLSAIVFSMTWYLHAFADELAKPIVPLYLEVAVVAQVLLLDRLQALAETPGGPETQAVNEVLQFARTLRKYTETVMKNPGDSALIASAQINLQVGIKNLAPLPTELRTRLRPSRARVAVPRDDVDHDRMRVLISRNPCTDAEGQEHQGSMLVLRRHGTGRSSRVDYDDDRSSMFIGYLPFGSPGMCNVLAGLAVHSWLFPKAIRWSNTRSGDKAETRHLVESIGSDDLDDYAPIDLVTEWRSCESPMSEIESGEFNRSNGQWQMLYRIALDLPSTKSLDKVYFLAATGSVAELFLDFPKLDATNGPPATLPSGISLLTLAALETASHKDDTLRTRLKIWERIPFFCGELEEIPRRHP